MKSVSGIRFSSAAHVALATKELPELGGGPFQSLKIESHS